ncbi:Nnf1-domain-containing protein [Lipomyces japonicus]|uniref:Nnf1-domain-containing protein n=1 Tax=Lipomyces japonicus TaxID=56871 RepID=UPI0034CFB6EF
MADKEKVQESDNNPTSIRNQRLREIFNRSLQSSTKALTFEKLAQCYPYVAEHGSNGLREAMNQAMRFWEASSIREFEAILQERNVAEKLAELDVLIEESRLRKIKNEEGNIKGSEKQLYVESLTPEEIANAHLTPIKLKEAERLEVMIQQAQANNKKLLQEVTSQEEEIDELFGNIKKSIFELSQAAKETDVLPDQQEFFRRIDEINDNIRK